MHSLVDNYNIFNYLSIKGEMWFEELERRTIVHTDCTGLQG